MSAPTLEHKSEAGLLDVEPYLFSRREYITAEDGNTTVCRSSGTSPVEEYTPDD